MTDDVAATGGTLSAESLLGFALPPRPPEGHTPAELHAIAQRLQLGRRAWQVLAPYLIFDPRSYRRVRLWRDDDWEALVLCWLPGQHTAIHDHGASTGLAYVLMGTLHEARYEWPGPGSRLRPRCGPRGEEGVEEQREFHAARDHF